MRSFPMLIKPASQRRTFKAVLSPARAQGGEKAATPRATNFAMQRFAVVTFVSNQPWCPIAAFASGLYEFRRDCQFMFASRGDAAGQDHAVGASERMPAIASQLMKAPSGIRIAAQSPYRQWSRVDQAIAQLGSKTTIKERFDFTKKPRKIISLSTPTKRRLVWHTARPGKTQQVPKTSFARRLQLTHDSTQRTIAKRGPQPAQCHIIDRINIGPASTHSSTKPTCSLSHEPVYFLPQQLAIHGRSPFQSSTVGKGACTMKR